jgi:hypothetical protein
VADLIDDAARELYAVAPDDFISRRAELVEAARKKDAAAANAIGKLRKPTVGAWLVNALVLGDVSIVDTLTDLGDRMRTAQDALDAGKLRELSNERRKIVDELTTKAFRKADRKQPPAALRDEVSGTFDAAIADPDVAQRLGMLQRAEQWSGFGFLPSGGAPQLTVVRGGKDQPRKDQPRKAAKQAPAKPKITAGQKRRLERALATAQRAFEDADAAFDEAQTTERDLTQELKRLAKQLRKLQDRVDDARAELEQARKDVTSTRARRREARSALDKAEREAP